MISQADLFNLSIDHCYITAEQQDYLPHHRSSWDATTDLDRLTATLALQSPCHDSVPAWICTSTQQEGHALAATDSQATLGLRLAALKSLLNALPQGSSNQLGEATAYSQRAASSTSYLGSMKIAPDYSADTPTYPACMGMYPTLPANSVPYIRSQSETWQMQQGQPMHAQIPVGWNTPNVPPPSSAHNYYQTTAHAVSNPSTAHEQHEPQGTGVFLPQPQRPLHSSARSQAKSQFRHKPAAAAVTARSSALSYTASDLSCQSSTHDFCLSASDSSSTAADLDTGALHSHLPDEWFY